MAESVWLIGLVALPAAINPGGALAIEPIKTSLLRVGAVIIAISWLVARLSGRPRVDVGAQPIVRAGLLVLGLAALSTMLSIEPATSFFGSFDRGMGWLSLAAGGVLLLSGAELWTDEARRERAITALLVGSLVPCAYALLQRLGADPLRWTNLGAPGSTLGSPTFLGGYLVLVAPFALYRVVSAGQALVADTGAGLRAAVSYALTLGLLLVMAAVVAQTTIRAPLAGLVVGALSFSVLAARRAGLGRLGALAAAALLAVALALAVVATGAAGLRGLQRFLDITRPFDSASERLTVWSDALPMPLTDPLRTLVGYGPETQPALLEHAEATVRRTQNQQWDRAHNLVLDTWLTGGLLGVAALLGLLLVAGRAMWGVYRAERSRRTLLASAVLAALLGHLVEVTFAFHTVVTAAGFWSLLGLAASLTPRPSRLAAADRRSSPALVWATSLIGVLLAMLLATPAVADALYGSARRAARTADLVTAIRQEETAAAWAPWVEELPRAAGLAWRQLATRRDDPRLLARAEGDLLEAARRAPLDPSPQLRLARLYLAWAERGGASDLLDRAETACQKALATGPYRVTVWSTCADVSRRRGQPEEAARRAARARALVDQRG